MFRRREELEERLLRLARTRGHTPAAERAVARFSSLGEHAGVWLAIGLGGGVAQPPRRADWRRARRAVAATYALNTAIKFARRPPPAGSCADLPPLIGTPTGLSFPSAHASTGFAGGTGLQPPRACRRFRSTAWPRALAYSRLYLGVHYPSDILAGALLGTAIAAVLVPAPGEPEMAKA